VSGQRLQTFQIYQKCMKSNIYLQLGGFSFSLRFESINRAKIFQKLLNYRMRNTWNLWRLSTNILFFLVGVNCINVVFLNKCSKRTGWGTLDETDHIKPHQKTTHIKKWLKNEMKYLIHIFSWKILFNCIHRKGEIFNL
jgi:hypothetical protein